ncbi:hypothetical protein ACSMXM_01140 [Pacificimonas sp. ICDLI1SI03]
MVMRKRQPRNFFPGNALLLWLGVGIFVIGGIFIYFYGSLRASNLSPVSSPAAASTTSTSSTVPRETANSLRELGIDAEASNLSPEAQSAIARAHQAALAAGRTETGADTSQQGQDAAPAATGDGGENPVSVPGEEAGNDAEPASSAPVEVPEM